MEAGRGQMWIFLFSKVTCTPLKDKVSTILPPIVGMEKKCRNSYLHTTAQIPMNIISYLVVNSYISSHA